MDKESKFYHDVFAALFGGDNLTTNHDIPLADCKNCEHKRLPHQELHCYMFKVKPGDRCGQFVPSKEKEELILKTKLVSKE